MAENTNTDAAGGRGNARKPSVKEMARLARKLGIGGPPGQKTGRTIDLLPPTPEGNAFSRGFGRGVDITQMGYGSALEGLGSLTGIKSLKDYGASIAENQAEELAAAEAGATRLKDVKEAKGFVETADKLLDFGLGSLGESLPQMATTLLGARAGSSLAARNVARTAASVGTKTATVSKASGAAKKAAISAVDLSGGAMAGGMGANIPFFYGMNREAQKQAIQEGKRVNMNEGAALLAAIPQSALDVISDSLVAGVGKIRPISGLGDIEAISRRGALYTRGAKGAALGVITEVPTELGQQVIERYQAGNDITSPEAIEEYIEVMAAAGLVGGSIRSASNIIAGDLEQQEKQQEKQDRDKRARDEAADKKRLKDAKDKEEQEVIKQEIADKAAAREAQLSPVRDRATTSATESSIERLVDGGLEAKDIDTYRGELKPGADGRWGVGHLNIILANKKAAESLANKAETPEQVDVIVPPDRLPILDQDQINNIAQSRVDKIRDIVTPDTTPEQVKRLAESGLRVSDVAIPRFTEDVQPDEQGRYTAAQLSVVLANKLASVARFASDDVSVNDTIELISQGFTTEDIETYRDRDPIEKVETLRTRARRPTTDITRTEEIKPDAEGKYTATQLQNMLARKKVAESNRAKVEADASMFNLFGEDLNKVTNKHKSIRSLMGRGLTPALIANYAEAVNIKEGANITIPQAEKVIEAHKKAVLQKEKLNRAETNGFDYNGEVDSENYKSIADEQKKLEKRYGVTINKDDILEHSGTSNIDLTNVKESELSNTARNKRNAEKGFGYREEKKGESAAENAHKAQDLLTDADLLDDALFEDANIEPSRRNSLSESNINKLIASKNSARELFNPTVSRDTQRRYIDAGLRKSDPEKYRGFPFDDVPLEPKDGTYTLAQLDRVLELKYGEAQKTIAEAPINQAYEAAKSAWLTFSKNDTQENKAKYSSAEKVLKDLVLDGEVTIPTDKVRILRLTDKTQQFTVNLKRSFESGDASVIDRILTPEQRTDEASVRSVLADFLSTDEEFFNRITIAANPESIGMDQLDPNTAGLVTTDQRVFLFTDNIQRGNEMGVFLHEVGQHLGMRTFLGANYNSLVENIKRFARRKNDSVEAVIATAAMERTRFANTEPSAVDDELVAYFIEEAVNRGISPTKEASRKSGLGNFFRRVVAGFRRTLRIFGLSQTPNAQEIVDLAYGAAGLALQTPFEKLTRVERDYNSVLSAPSFLQSLINREKPRNGASYADRQNLMDSKMVGKLAEGAIPVVRWFKKIALGALELNMLSDTVREHYKHIEGGVLNPLGAKLANRIDQLDRLLNLKVSDAKRLATDSDRLEIEISWTDPETNRLVTETFNTEEEAINKQAELKSNPNIDSSLVESKTVGWGVNSILEREPELTTKHGEEVMKSWNELTHEASRLQVKIQSELTPEQLNTLTPEEMKRAKDLGYSPERYLSEKVDVYTKYRALIATRPDLDVYFTDVQNMHKTMWKSFVDTVARKFGGNEGLAKEYLNKIGIDMDKFTLDPYIPLWREGNIVLSYIDNTGDFVERRFKTNRDAQEAKRDVERLNYKDISLVDQSPMLAAQAKRDNEAIVELVNDFKKKYPDNPEWAESLEEFLVSNSDSSPIGGVIGARGTDRKNIKGYEPDMIKALANISVQMAGQIADIEYNGEISRVHLDINNIGGGDADKLTLKEQDFLRDIQAEIELRRKFHLNPVNAYLANLLTGVSYKYFILGSPASALVNLTSIPIQSFGVLARTHGPMAALKALMAALKMAFRGLTDSAANTKLTVPGLNVNLSDKTAFTEDMMKDNPELRELFAWSTARGGVRSSYNPDYDVLQVKAKESPSKSLWERASRTLGWAFQNTERATREVTMIAAYNLERDRQKALSKSDLNAELDARLAEEPDASQFTRKFANDRGALEKEIAREKALQTVYRTQTSGLRAAGSRYLQNNYGKVAGSLKSFALGMMYLQWTMARDIFKGVTGPKVKGVPNPGKLAGKMWMSLAVPSWMLAGIPGIPLYFVPNFFFMLAQNFDGDEDDESLESWLNRNLADFAARGPFGAVTGLDVADRVAFKELLIRDDPYRKEKVGPASYYLELGAGPLFSAVRRSLEGAAQLTSGIADKGPFETSAYLEASKFGLPLALSNVARGLDPNFGKTRKGDILTENRGVDDRIWQMLGFGDFETKGTRNKLSRMRGLKQTALERKSNILNELNVARSSGAGVPSYVSDMIRDFNRSNLAKTEIGPITGKTIATSFDSYHRRRREAESNRARFGVPYPGPSPDSSVKTYTAADLRR